MKKIDREIRWFKIFENVRAAEARIEMDAAIAINLKNYGMRLCLVRTITGYYAANDACPHKAVSLSKGYATINREIVCPLHNYRFDLVTGQETSGQPCTDLQTYPVRIDETGLYIGIAPAILAKHVGLGV